jgi:hypothetical protein
MWNPTPEEAHAAKLIAGSWAGAMVVALWRKGATFMERAAWHVCSIMSGVALGGYISTEYRLPVEVAGFAAGLLGVVLAFRAISAAEKFDIWDVVKFIFRGPR